MQTITLNKNQEDNNFIFVPITDNETSYQAENKLYFAYTSEESDFNLSYDAGGNLISGLDKNYSSSFNKSSVLNIFISSCFLNAFSSDQIGDL